MATIHRSVFVFLLLVCAATAAFADDDLTFERDIRPLFRAHCFDCHGATDETEGSLDLRLVRFMQGGGDSGAAIVAGKPDQSLLVERIRSGEMPPGEHRVPKEELAIIERWIAAGAPTARPEPESIPPGLGITEEERSFWSLQPIRTVEVPDLNSFGPSARVRTAVDALVAQSFPDDTTFADDADRQTLIKRAWLTLLGLPPTPAEMDYWLAASEDDWWARLIDELLASPHYGERWGRHWLDVAGYADSEGANSKDVERRWAWKYRDWVITAFNEDKPFNEFLTEQLAGDELAGPKKGEWTPEQIAQLTATGFLRMAADGTGSGGNTPEGRNQVMTDTLKILGTSLMGLSLQCAQCHDHRYDPISQADYYGIRAIFEPALDWNAWKVPSGRQVSLYTAEDHAAAAKIEEETKTIAADRKKKLDELMKQAFETELAKADASLHDQLREAFDTADDKRTDAQKKLVASHPNLKITPGNLYLYIPDSRATLKEYDVRIAKIRAKKPEHQYLRALVEPANHVPETKLFHRGDHQQPKQKVMPAALTLAAPENQRPVFAANDEALPTTGRRLAFAKWLTSGQHPLLARVFVNRIWLHHFGDGLVSTPTDFGKLGTEPQHPELLDWLAAEFMNNGWSIKNLHRVIMTSTVWMQSCSKPDGAHAADLSRRKLVRLDAEIVRDRMLSVAGQLDQTMFGKPINVKVDETGQVMVEGEQKRRSLYVKSRRSQPVAMMQAFDAPVMQTNCELRPKSTVATQSLMLMNGDFTLKQAAALANRLVNESSPLSNETCDQLPELPAPHTSAWSYGFGQYDAAQNATVGFTPLTHWTGSGYQTSAALPDAKNGWVYLSATGGHPDVDQRSAVRRWTAPAAGKLSITGELQHPSPNGDGVIGRIICSRGGKVGEWKVANGKAASNVADIEVAAGDTLDFVTSCNANFTSDGFSWKVALNLQSASGEKLAFSSENDFAAPAVSREVYLGQVAAAWRFALCREPDLPELQTATAFVAEQIASFRVRSDLPQGRSAEQQALVSLCQTLLCSNEFLYMD